MSKKKHNNENLRLFQTKNIRTSPVDVDLPGIPARIYCLQKNITLLKHI